MKINAKLKSMRLDLNKYRDALRKTLEEAIHDAAFTWLQTVVAAVPSWSGASRGTLLKLAAELNTQVDISVEHSAAASVGDRTSLGLANSNAVLDVEKASDGKVSFRYSTSLAHLIWNEYNNANINRDRTKWRHVELHQPGPYHFQEKGQAAVKHVFQDVRLPNPSKFIVGKTI